MKKIVLSLLIIIALFFTTACTKEKVGEVKEGSKDTKIDRSLYNKRDYSFFDIKFNIPNGFAKETDSLFKIHGAIEAAIEYKIEENVNLDENDTFKDHILKDTLEVHPNEESLKEERIAREEALVGDSNDKNIKLYYIKHENEIYVIKVKTTKATEDYKKDLDWFIRSTNIFE